MLLMIRPLKGATFKEMFGPIRNRRTFELVEQEIRETILSGTLSPGDRLPSERDLANEMKVGRSVVREALRNLESSGLVHIKQGVSGGIFVKAPDSSVLTRSFYYLIRLGEITIDQLTEARLIIEKDIVELAMKKNKHKRDYQQGDEIITRGFENFQRGVDFFQDNLDFHRFLAELCDNPILTMMANSIMSIFTQFIEQIQAPVDHCKRILESHRDILEEMKRGNRQGAVKAIEEHVLFFADEFRSLNSSRSISLERIPITEKRPHETPGITVFRQDQS